MPRPGVPTTSSKMLYSSAFAQTSVVFVQSVLNPPPRETKKQERYKKGVLKERFSTKRVGPCKK